MNDFQDLKFNPISLRYPITVMCQPGKLSFSGQIIAGIDFPQSFAHRNMASFDYVYRSQSQIVKAVTFSKREKRFRSHNL